jgi:cytochrome b
MRQINLPMPIWDLPIRLFHWILVVLLGFMWLSGKQGWLTWHMYAGYAILSLLIFRVIWGFIGSDTARFLFFLKSPIEALRHLSHITKREPDHEVGHNAAGGWMVLGLLGLLFAQVLTGLGANNDVSVEGPLANAVGKDMSDLLSSWHRVFFKMIQIAAALHILAIVTYAVLKRHDLVRPMITGKKPMPGAMTPPRIVSWKLGLVVWLIAVALVVALVNLAP